MEAFLRLYQRLDQTQSRTAKLQALRTYFEQADPHEAAWAAHLLRGGTARRFLPPKKLRLWLAEYLALPPSLVETCYQEVGDLAETLALLLPNRHRPYSHHFPSLTHLTEVELPRLSSLPEAEQRRWLTYQWDHLSFWEAFLLHKLLLGAFRVGVAEGLVVQALAQALHLPETHVAARLHPALTPPSPHFYLLLRQNSPASTQPYPFCLACPIEELTEPLSTALGQPSDYQIEWKWDGVRVQLVRREGEVALWSRGGVCLNSSFPELLQRYQVLPPSTVLDGELLIIAEGKVQPFAALQRRLLRKKITPALLKALPAEILVYDLLEWQGHDLRAQPLIERRAQLEQLAKAYPFLRLSPTLSVQAWPELETLRAKPPLGAEGLMLKHRQSPYLAGRRRGAWWKYKRDPFTVDAVLVYAQAGHGRRSGWFSDLTFALWDEAGQLVTFAKAYSGLSEAELRELTRWIRTHALEKIGPIVKVPPVWVFEIAFEAIQPSARHKCGYAVRFPRIRRWRRDKKPEEADSLSALRRWANDSYPS